MITKLGMTIAGVVTNLLWTTNAFAAGEWLPGGGGGDGGDVVGNPEIDGPGALLVVAVLASLGVMIYRKAQK